MRFSARTEPWIKSAAYAILALLLLVFSSSFYPALHLSVNLPRLTVAFLLCLALFEGIRYTSYFAVIFGTAEAFVFGGNPLLTALFYLGIAFFGVWLFENIFTRGFLAWLLYMLGGNLLFGIFLLFAPVTDWGITAADILREHTLPTYFLSALFSLPLYPTVARIKRKTEGGPR